MYGKEGPISREIMTIAYISSVQLQAPRKEPKTSDKKYNNCCMKIHYYCSLLLHFLNLLPISYLQEFCGEPSKALTHTSATPNTAADKVSIKIYFFTH